MATMDMTFVHRLLSSGDARRMGDAAKDLGVLLTRRESESFRRILDVIHGVRHEDDFARGFVLALRHVLDSFVAQLDREANDAALTRLAERDGVRDVLIALQQGDRLPSQMATRTDRARSQITAILKDLEAAGLVESDGESSEDARMRPRVLTTRGSSLAHRLARHADTPMPADVSATVAAVLECFAALVAREHVARADLQELMDRRLPAAAAVRGLSALEQVSRTLGLAVLRDETFWFVESRLQDVVAEHLVRATNGDRAALEALLPSLANGYHLIVRTAQHKDAWCRLKQICRLDSVEVIGTGEARLETEVRSTPFGVIYDSGVEVQSDLSSANRQSYIDPAETRWLHALAQSDVPAMFERASLVG